MSSTGPPRMPESAPPSLRHRVIGLIGRGASARVYEAELIGPWEFRKRVALKVLDVRIDEGNLQQVIDLVHEARLGGQLQHPNLVEIYECGQVGDHPYIAMERIEGATLAETIAWQSRQDQVLPVEAAIDVGIQVCRGLTYAHAATRDGLPLGLVHRDLKPANLMISRHSVVKVMDFGIARVLGGDDGGMTRGTPLYMSPEQVRGEPLTARSDLFCLGTVLYEAATGRMLFHDTSVEAILRRVSEVRLEDRLEVLRRRHAGLATVVARCLRPSPRERYATSAELGAELRVLADRSPLRGELADLLPPPRQLGDGSLEEPEWPEAGAFTRAFFSRPPTGVETESLPDPALADDTDRDPRGPVRIVPVPVVAPRVAPPPSVPLWRVAAIASVGAILGVAAALGLTLGGRQTAGPSGLAEGSPAGASAPAAPAPAAPAPAAPAAAPP
ncbi:serine/threonine protein kinase, partial [Myxococcota bacterium]|nr:serine/threonine protein kinase [Myxococcota bacterium]